MTVEELYQSQTEYLVKEIKSEISEIGKLENMNSKLILLRAILEKYSILKYLYDDTTEKDKSRKFFDFYFFNQLIKINSDIFDQTFNTKVSNHYKEEFDEKMINSIHRGKSLAGNDMPFRIENSKKKLLELYDINKDGFIEFIIESNVLSLNDINESDVQITSTNNNLHDVLNDMNKIKLIDYIYNKMNNNEKIIQIKFPYKSSDIQSITKLIRKYSIIDFDKCEYTNLIKTGAITYQILSDISHGLVIYNGNKNEINRGTEIILKKINEELNNYSSE